MSDAQLSGQLILVIEGLTIEVGAPVDVWWGDGWREVAVSGTSNLENGTLLSSAEPGAVEGDILEFAGTRVPNDLLVDNCVNKEQHGVLENEEMEKLELETSEHRYEAEPMKN
ncbi:Uncharacterized protein Fot_39729 [Forsythia ovata]|uniref:Uncharacterized protein n=1 Tax=Forsythia ovata TaxID=205694 RepID=A0ABD1S5H8_9LAMI